MKAAVQNLLLTIVSLTCSLVLAEVAVALFHPTTSVTTDILGRRIMNRERPVGARVGECVDWAPNQKGREKLLDSYDVFYEINSLSLRHGELPAQLPDAFRILVLGDSQTFGQGIDQDRTFSAVLQELLNSSGSAIRYQVFNGGVNGYGTFDELCKLKRLAPVLKPSLVVAVAHVDNALVMDEGNDLMNNYKKLHDSGTAALKRSDRALVAQSPKIAFFADHSHLYGLLSAIKGKLTRHPTFVDEVREYGRTSRQSPQHRSIWDQTRAAFIDMARVLETQQTKGKLIILHLPGLASLELDDQSALDELMQTRLTVISTYPSLQKLRAGETMLLRFRGDAHYNVAAHEVIGRALYEGLVTHSVVPR